MWNVMQMGEILQYSTCGSPAERKPRTFNTGENLLALF